MIKGFGLLVWLLVSVAFVAPVMAAPTVFMEAHLLNANGENTESLDVKVGQRVTLALDILTTTWFTRAPDIQPMDLRGAINLQSQQFGTNYSVNRQGVSYAVQRREITIFPQRAGQFIIPSQVAKVWVAGDDGARLAEQEVRSEPLVFQVEAFTAAETQGDQAGQNLLVAEELVISETFEPSLASLSDKRTLFAGDAIIRRVTIKAKGTLGMLIKPMPWPNIDDVAQQASRAEVSDRTNRSEFTGIRIETRSYVFERDGEFILPAMKVYWWDQTQDLLSEVNLPEHNITVAKGGLLSAGDALVVEVDKRLSDYWRPWMLVALLAIVSVLLLAWFVLRLVKVFNSRRARYRQGEHYHRRLLLRACSCADRDSIMRGFYAWHQRLPNMDQQSPAMQELQDAITDYYQIYYQLDANQHKDRLTRLVQSIHAIPHRESFEIARLWLSSRRSWLPSRRRLVELNP